jgi:hypothetical protein
MSNLYRAYGGDGLVFEVKSTFMTKDSKAGAIISVAPK